METYMNARESSDKKTSRPTALLLGGTGAMGVYLAQYLIEDGWNVEVTTRSSHASASPGLAYVRGNAKDFDFMRRMLAEKHYDAIVDFMVWTTAQFRERFELFESHAGQYVFLSSYRVFADSPVITEESPRLLDVCEDRTYLATDEYGLAKARQEDLLRAGKRQNYTIIRPSITYSKARFQLCTLECEQWLWRTLHGKAIPLVPEMLAKQTTLTWAGHASRFIAKLIGNPQAIGEAVNVVTAEHHTWQQVLDLYEKILGRPIKVKHVTLDQYIETVRMPYQVRYDRMFNRILDNSKALCLTGIDPQSLTPLDTGLRSELRHFLEKPSFRPIDAGFMARADHATGQFTNPFQFGPKGTLKYCCYRLPGNIPDTIDRLRK